MNNEILLADDHIIETVAVLRKRIDDRFPQCGLANLCGQLQQVAEQSSRRAAWIGARILWIRITSYCMAAALVGLILGTIGYLASNIRMRSAEWNLTDVLTNFDAATNGVIVIGACLFFLIRLESRIKRGRALAAIHELRAIAHVVDMHQLTKDPERLQRGYQSTSHSPTKNMTPRELSRYLDYCTEMLSLIGKIAALYVQRFDDSVAVAAVSEVEQLTTGLSRKIWQKIVILSQDLNSNDNDHNAPNSESKHPQAKTADTSHPERNPLDTPPESPS